MGVQGEQVEGNAPRGSPERHARQHQEQCQPKDCFETHSWITSLGSRATVTAELARPGFGQGRLRVPRQPQIHSPVAVYHGPEIVALLDSSSPGRGKRREGSGSRESAGPWKGLPEALAEMPESSVLVFVDGRLGTGNPLLRLLSPLGEARAFESIRQRAVPDWIRERAAKLALSISPRAVSLLADLVGR